MAGDACLQRVPGAESRMRSLAAAAWECQRLDRVFRNSLSEVEGAAVAHGNAECAAGHGVDDGELEEHLAAGDEDE